MPVQVVQIQEERMLLIVISTRSPYVSRIRAPQRKIVIFAAGTSDVDASNNRQCQASAIQRNRVSFTEIHEATTHDSSSDVTTAFDRNATFTTCAAARRRRIE